jgi:mono/diheme cytochrome c family protein
MRMTVRFLRSTMLMALLYAGCAFAVTHILSAADDPSPASAGANDDGLSFFEHEVLPVLEQNCFRCHGAGKLEGNLSLAVRESILAGGDSGPAVDLVDPAASLLVDAINYGSYEMPPTGKMSPQNIATLTKWVERGLPMPAEVQIADAGHHPPEINDETRAFWSFQPIVRPEVPAVSRQDWVHNPIDAFILAKLDAAGLAANPPADPGALYRRLHYDLLGLPPSPEAVEAFATAYAADPETTWTQAVDELLESPHYGEHWARYWLDLVRYAESNSFERDNAKPFVWRYRDYVIRSLNDDKPYDQFIREQLAGDELDQVTTDSIIATGYYRLGLWDDEPADPLLAFYDGLDDIVTTTSQGFLGLTMNCARCHDHKLDPIPQADYYRFVAFFRNVRHYGQRSDESVTAASVRSIATPDEERAHSAERAEWQDRVARLRRQLDTVEEQIRPHLEGGEIDDFERDSERQRVIEKYVGELISREEFREYRQTRERWSRASNNPPRSAQQALVVKESGRDAPVTHVLLRGNPTSEGDVVEPQFPEVLGFEAPTIVRPEHVQESSGRRRALAEWIASPQNPLTARVMANRLWQWHFGRGIVRSTNNFGLQGDAPTHPELLDWLAAEFIERGWSIKSMHRLILTSNAYRMSSAAQEAALAQDPINNLFWRFDMRRLRAEEIRDSILAVNGTLNLDIMYGPSIYPEIPEEVLAGQSNPGSGWNTSSEEDARRRSIYIHIKRSLQLPLLAAFDSADTDFTCPERFVSTQPTQALGMLNSEFLGEQANLLAEEVTEIAPEDERTQVRLALRRVMQHEPSDADINRGLALLESLRSEDGLGDTAARKYFCLLALNLNEFVYLD